jgi:hypothetical protein
MARELRYAERRAALERARQRILARTGRDPWTYGNALAAVQAIASELDKAAKESRTS